MRWIVLLVATLSFTVATYLYLRGGQKQDQIHTFCRQKLKEAQTEIQQNPASSFWHNQAAVAFDCLGDFQGFEREIRLVVKLDPTDTANYQTAYAIYKRRQLHAERDEVLRKWIEADRHDPIAHYELGFIYEGRGDWQGALREYQTVQNLLQRLNPGQELEGPDGRQRLYVDFRGKAYPVEFLFQEIPSAIKRASTKVQKR